jgi:hypothetical protein
MLLMLMLMLRRHKMTLEELKDAAYAVFDADDAYSTYEAYAAAQATYDAAYDDALKETEIHAAYAVYEAAVAYRDACRKCYESSKATRERAKTCGCPSTYNVRARAAYDDALAYVSAVVEVNGHANVLAKLDTHNDT